MADGPTKTEAEIIEQMAKAIYDTWAAARDVAETWEYTRQIGHSFSALARAEAANAFAVVSGDRERLHRKACAAAREMRERCAEAVRNKICEIDWPPDDGDKLIDDLCVAIRALPDTPALIANDGRDAT